VAHCAVDDKVRAIFRRLAGDRLVRLDGARLASEAIAKIAAALAGLFAVGTVVWMFLILKDAIG